MSTPTILMSATQAGAGGGSMAAIVNFMMPMLLVFAIFWILVLRPQNRRVKEHQASIAAVKKGDEVITGGGIRGRVTRVSDDEAEVEIANGVKVRVVKTTLTQVLGPTGEPANDPVR
jgi:preprotein translocase subunit YajC